jgi:hypothetical protein
LGRASVVKAELVPLERVERAILMLRGHRVLLDHDLAALYGVEVKVLKQAVRRNIERFPGDFMFALSMDEARSLERTAATAFWQCRNANASKVTICDLKHRTY